MNNFNIITHLNEVCKRVSPTGFLTKIGVQMSLFREYYIHRTIQRLQEEEVKSLNSKQL